MTQITKFKKHRKKGGQKADQRQKINQRFWF